MSPSRTLTDKALTPLGTRDRRLADRQANPEKCPCCPLSLRRHPCPFATPLPMCLYHIDNEWLRSRIPGTAEPKSSPTVPNLASDGGKRRKPAANAPASLTDRRPAIPCPHRKAASSDLVVAPRRTIVYRAALREGRAALQGSAPIPTITRRPRRRCPHPA